MKYKCDMIRDLMPLCADNAAADASKNAVVEHIAECKECENYYSKVINEIPLNSDYPDERRGYVEIAKKIRRQKIQTRTIITLVILAVFELLINFAAGYRFTAESAASLSGRLNTSSKLAGNYNWGDWRFYIYDSANSYDVVTVNKHWNGWKAQDNYLVWPKYPSDKGGIINAGCIYYWTDTDGKFGIQLFPIIVEDPAVASVEVTVFNKTKSINAETNKLTILTFENQNPLLGNEAAGYAYDSAGNVLYKLVLSDETGRWLWQKDKE
jgi:hypothetical protein